MMKKLSMLCTILVLCCLSSCQRTLEDNAPMPAGSARMEALMSDDELTITDQEWQAQGFGNELQLSDMPASVQGVLNNYFSQLSSLESQVDANVDGVLIGLVATTTQNAIAAMGQLPLGGQLSAEKRAAAVAALEGTLNNLGAAYGHVLHNQDAWENGMVGIPPQILGLDSFSLDPIQGDAQAQSIFNGKKNRFWRALVRLVVAVAVTAVLIAIPVAAVLAVKAAIGLIAPSAIATGVGAALTKGFILGGFKVMGALSSGLITGFYYAAKNWFKPWQGSVEFMFGIKLKTFN